MNYYAIQSHTFPWFFFILETLFYDLASDYNLFIWKFSESRCSDLVSFQPTSRGSVKRQAGFISLYFQLPKGAIKPPHIQTQSLVGRSAVLAIRKTWAWNNSTRRNPISCLRFLGTPIVMKEVCLVLILPSPPVAPNFSNPKETDPMDWGRWGWWDVEKKKKVSFHPASTHQSVFSNKYKT